MADDKPKRVREGITKFIDKDGKITEEELWDYDPDCLHEIDPYHWSGIKCIKCGGWFCY